MKRSKFWKRKRRGQTRGSPKNPFYWFSKKGKVPDDDEAGIIRLQLGKKISSNYFNASPEEADAKIPLASHTTTWEKLKTLKKK